MLYLQTNKGKGLLCDDRERARLTILPYIENLGRNRIMRLRSCEMKEVVVDRDVFPLNSELQLSL